MQRRSFINQAGIAGILAAGAAPAIVHAQATIRWRLASSFPKSLDTIYGATETFQEGGRYVGRQIPDLVRWRRTMKPLRSG